MTILDLRAAQVYNTVETYFPELFARTSANDARPAKSERGARRFRQGKPKGNLRESLNLREPKT